MATDAIITADDLAKARGQIRSDGLAKTMDTLQRTEPELYDFVMTAAQSVAGRLALFEVQQRTVRATADDVLETVLTCLLAARASHVRLWEPPKELEGEFFTDVPF